MNPMVEPQPEIICIIKEDTFGTRIKNKIDHFFNVLVAVAIIAELIIMFSNAMSRAVFHSSILWSQEIGELSLVVIAFIGGAIAYPRGEHISVEVFVNLLSKRGRAVLGAIAQWIVFGICFGSAILTVELGIKTFHDKTPILDMSRAWFALPMVLGLLLLSYHSLLRIGDYPKKIVIMTGAGLIALFLLLTTTQPLWVNLLHANAVLGLALLVFVILLFIGIPIGFVLAAASLFYIYISGSNVPLTAVPLAMEHGVLNFVLLAIPFFVMTGYIMSDGGLSRRLIDSVMSLIGRVRGGLLHVIIVVMYIVSGLSGSKIADVAAVGSTMNDSLRKEGYHPGEGAAVLAAAAVMGETVPPSIAMLVLGSISTLSVGTLFVAGLLPAVVMAVVLMVLISIRARMAGMPLGPKVPMKETVRRAFVAIPALLAPILLIGGVISGIGTPTEVSSTAVMYCLFLGVVMYKEINLKDFWRIILDSAAKAGMVLFIIGTASAFSWSLTMARVPHNIAEFMTTYIKSPSMFMLVTIIVLIIMGAMLEGLPALLIFGPLLLPIAPQFGINPLQFGIVLIIAMGIGIFLPPIGVGAYVCVSVMKTTVEDMMQHIVPYFTFLLIGILLIAFVPWFSLVVPRIFHLIQ